MTEKDITSAFELLLETIHTTVSTINLKGSQYFSEGNYFEASNLIDKAEKIIDVQNKAMILHKEWLDLDNPVKIVNKIPSQQKSKIVQRSSSKKLPTGLRTNTKDFKMPILDVIVSLGGSAPRQVVFEKLESIMADILNEYDWETLPSDNRSIRWKNNAAWARQYLIEDGFLSKSSSKGVWEITEAGRKALDESKKKINS